MKTLRLIFVIFSTGLVTSVGWGDAFASQQTAEYDFLYSLDIEQASFLEQSWQFSFELNDSGIDDEDELREVLSASKLGLLAPSDFFALDYETDTFDRYHALSLQYDSEPFYQNWYLSFQANYSQEEIEFKEPGLDELDDISWGAGFYSLELHSSAEWVWQWGIGARWVSVDSENAAIYENESANEFFLPGIKWMFQQDGDPSTDVSGYLMLEWNEPTIADTKSVKVDLIVPSLVLQQMVDLQIEVALEKQFKILSGGYRYLKTVKKPGTIFKRYKFEMSGQYSFGDMLLPQFQQSVGGLYSVRGYDDQIVSGTRVVEATFEYQLLAVTENAADSTWNAWLFLFVDWADLYRDQVTIYARSSFENLNGERQGAGTSLQLASAGVGVDIYQNDRSVLNIAIAQALKDDEVETRSGDHRVHAYFRFTF